MKNITKIILFLLVFMLVGITAASAAEDMGTTAGLSVYANNSAKIVWKSLSFSSNLEEYGYYYSWSRAYTAESWGLPAEPDSPPYVSDYKNADATDAYMISGSEAIFNFAAAHGSTTSDLVKAKSKAEASVPGDAFSAHSLAQRGMVYHLKSDGGFSFSVPFRFIKQELYADAGDAYGYIRAWALLRRWVSDDNYEDIGVFEAEVSEHNISSDNFSLTPTGGILTLSFNGTAGQYFLLETGVDAKSVVQKAVVPIPGAVWMLLSGLLGLVGIRRLRN